jgi:hypothetical protein
MTKNALGKSRLRMSRCLCSKRPDDIGDAIGKGPVAQQCLRVPESWSTALMSLKNFLTGLAGNFIAAGIGWYVQGPNTGLIIVGAGVILLLAVFLFTKQSATPIIPAASPVNVHQEKKQEFNPQFNPTFSAQQNVFVGIGDPNEISTEREKASQESIMTEYMKKTHPTSGYLIDEVARELNLSMPDVRDIMERLRTKQVVWWVNLNESRGRSWLFSG